MAVLPVIPNVHRVTWHWTFGTQRAMNVQHYSSTLSGSVAVLTAIQNALPAGLLSATVVGARLASMSDTPLDGISPTVDLATTGAKFDGVLGTEAQVAPAILVKLITGQRATEGARHRGRSYMPFVAEEAYVNGSLSGAQLTALQTAWSGFLTALTGANVPLHVASYGRPADPTAVPPITAVPPTSLPVLTATVEVPFATQRRRQNRLR